MDAPRAVTPAGAGERDELAAILELVNRLAVSLTLRADDLSVRISEQSWRLSTWETEAHALRDEVSLLRDQVRVMRDEMDQWRNARPWLGRGGPGIPAVGGP